jgi:DNA-binding NarL/FixJ family response regulator
MKILLVEDDHVQAGEFGDALAEAFPNVQLQTIGSEHSFYSMLDELEKKPPDIIVMDVMLRWARASSEMPEAPEEVINEKHYRAGFRCVKYLSERKMMRNVNIILYTVLQPTDIETDIKSLPSNVTYLVKDEDYNQFIRTIRRLTANR